MTYIDNVVQLVEQKTNLKSKNTIRYYALLTLVKGENVTLKDVHDGWAMNMNFKEANPPYCYGHEHKSIVPFNELNKETQDKDIKYVEAIKEVARTINGNKK